LLKDIIKSNRYRSSAVFFVRELTPYEQAIPAEYRHEVDIHMTRNHSFRNDESYRSVFSYIRTYILDKRLT